MEYNNDRSHRETKETGKKTKDAVGYIKDEFVRENINSEKKFFENQLVNYKEAAQYLGISESFLRRLKSKDKIRFVEIGQRGIRFKVASLNLWIAEREI